MSGQRSAGYNAASPCKHIKQGAPPNRFMKNLDEILRDAKPYNTITLEAGEYVIRGYVDSDKGTVIKDGIRLIGQVDERGVPTTTIILEPDVTDRSVTALYGGKHISLVNLNVDCNVGNEEVLPVKRQGIWLNGEANVIRNCHVTNLYGNRVARKECFGIAHNGVGGHIFECSVTQPRGDYIYGILSNGGMVERCLVDFTGGTPNGIFSGMGCAGIETGGDIRPPANNIQFRRNRIVNACYGWYMDTGSVTNLKISYNRFESCQQGVTFHHYVYADQTQPQEVVNVKIYKNKFLLAPGGDIPVAVFSLLNGNQSQDPSRCGLHCINNVVMLENEANYRGPASDPVWAVRITTQNDKHRRGIDRIRLQENVFLGPVTWQWMLKQGEKPVRVAVVDEVSKPWNVELD